MLRNISKLELKVNERVYCLLCEMDSPIIEAKEALFQFLKYLEQVEDAAKAVQEKSSEIEVEQKCNDTNCE